MPPTLIAHRGFPARCPENTLVGYRAALTVGAQWLETDIQFSRDGVPLLYHDDDLQRTSNRRGNLADFTGDELRQWDAAERDRFGTTYAGEPIPRLREFVRLLEDHEAVQAMIELKPESLARVGVDTAVRRVLKELDPILDRCVIISKDLDALSRSRGLAEVRVGWVMLQWDETQRELADDHGPDYLIVAKEQLAGRRGPLWSGTWHWVAYSIDDPELALELAHRGIEFVETDAIGNLMADERFRHIDQHRTL